MKACTGEPISWLRLEAFALALAGDRAPGDAEARAIEAHLATCPTCTRCLAEIRSDLVPLPGLIAMPVRTAEPAPRSRRWWAWAVPAMALAAAATVVLVLGQGRDRDRDALAPNTATIKGVGLVALEVIRERDGTIRSGMHTFTASDRWKLVVTCAPGPNVWVDTAVLDGTTTDHPLAPAALACGNRVALPGAFSLTGLVPNHVCIRIALGAPPPRTPPPRPGLPGVACITLDPE